MKFSVLDLTQSILSSLDSDEVNSINDTTEALQVANLIKTVYNDIISRANLPEHFDLFELDPSNDPDKPTMMLRPEGLMNLLWLKYDKRLVDDTESNYQVVKYLDPKSFSDIFLTYKNQNVGDIIKYTISTSNSSSIEIVGLNNKWPDYYTCYDDKTVIFDSYDASVDTTLQKNKTMAYGEFEAVFKLEDDFVPDLDSRQFSLLLNEAKALAFAELKQTGHEIANRNSKRSWVTLAHQKQSLPANVPFFNKLPNYGRRK